MKSKTVVVSVLGTVTFWTMIFPRVTLKSSRLLKTQLTVSLASRSIVAVRVAFDVVVPPSGSVQTRSTNAHPVGGVSSVTAIGRPASTSVNVRVASLDGSVVVSEKLSAPRPVDEKLNVLLPPSSTICFVITTVPVGNTASALSDRS